MKKLILILALVFCMLFSFNTLALEKVDTSGAGLTPARFQEKCRDIVIGANLPYYQLTFQTPVNAVASQGTITMAGIAVTGETFAIGTQTFTWKAARSVAGEVTIGADAPAAVTNIVTAITADLATVTAVDGAGDTVVVTAVIKGIVGNSIVFTEASTNMTVNGAGTLGTTRAGVDGTVGGKGDAALDATYLYICIDINTIADNNWRRIALGSAY